MSEFQPKTLCVLGRQPKLGLAELESLYSAGHVRSLGSAALLDIDVDEINFKGLGGTLKLARVLSLLPTTQWKDLEQYLVEKIPEHLQHVPAGSFTLGVSAYDLAVSVSTINKSLLGIKKIIKASGRSTRVVPNKEPALNSAQVLHNKLTSKGAWELLFVGDGEQTILAQSLFVQDIEAYGARDQARPKRDARVGMLPPKLAQIMINLANPSQGGLVLDPFCGTGVVLQEALLMDYSVIGTDLEERMVNYSLENLSWLKNKYPDIGQFNVHQADATSFRWNLDADAVVSETYLGRPLSKVPPSDDLNKILHDVNTIVQKFLNNIALQLESGTPLCLAVPAWQVGKDKFKHLPIIDRLSGMGYNQLDLKHVRREELIYYRPDQIVARQLIVLERK